MQGNRIFTGDTQWGKSTLADRHALAANDVGQPFLVIDRMPAKNWLGKVHAQSVTEVLERLYGKPAQNVYWSPKSFEEADRVMLHVHNAGSRGARRTVLYDECAIDQSTNFIGDGTSQAMRGWAHSGNLYLWVTQRFHELNGVIYVCSPSIRVFHTEHEKSLQRIHEELRLPVDKIRTLQVGECEIYGRDQ